MAIIIYCGVYTGALVRHADASLAYGGWPLPFHDLVPHSEQDWVQLTHRIMAFIVFTIIMITYIHAVKIIQIIVLFIMVIQLHLYLLYYKLSQVHYLL